MIYSGNIIALMGVESKKQDQRKGKRIKKEIIDGNRAYMIYLAGCAPARERT